MPFVSPVLAMIDLHYRRRTRINRRDVHRQMPVDCPVEANERLIGVEEVELQRRNSRGCQHGIAHMLGHARNSEMWIRQVRAILQEATCHCSSRVQLNQVRIA